MPIPRVAMQEFEIQRVDYLSPEANGRIGGVQAGFPLWAAVYTLADMEPAESDVWRAWMANMRGATRRFLGRDLSRIYPLEYPDGFAGMTRHGGGAFDGTATSWSENINSDDDAELTLNGLPSALILSQGDYIGFTWTATDDGVAGLTWHAVVRVVEGATAAAGVVTVTTEPPLPSAVPAGAVAYLNEPKCVMALEIGQSSLGAIDRRYAIRGGQIVGVQDLRG